MRYSRFGKQRVDDAVSLAQQMANGELGQLRLNFSLEPACLIQLQFHSIRLFQQQYPKVQLRLEEGNSFV